MKIRNAWRRLRLPEWATIAAQGVSLVCTWGDISGMIPNAASAVSFALLVAHGLRRRGTGTVPINQLGPDVRAPR